MAKLLYSCVINLIVWTFLIGNDLITSATTSSPLSPVCKYAGLTNNSLAILLKSVNVTEQLSLTKIIRELPSDLLDDEERDRLCIKPKCQVDTNNTNPDQLVRVAGRLLLEHTMQPCARFSVKSRRPTTAQLWGLGLLDITIINLGSLLGALLVPCLRAAWFPHVLTFAVGLGVSALATSAVLFLIPESLQIPALIEQLLLARHRAPFARAVQPSASSSPLYLGDASRLETQYVWVGVCVLAGLYLFFNFENVLQFQLDRRRRRATARRAREPDEEQRGAQQQQQLEIVELINMENGHRNASSHSHVHSHSHSHTLNKINGAPLLPAKPSASKQPGIATSAHEIPPVAWMIILGDTLHNFVDGLTIGSTLASNLLAGVSVSLAILCEELPHELGDFSILLQAGLPVRRVLCLNFCSALSCYLGFVLGALLTRLATTASHWISAVAAGMFLYIALSDMLPELAARARKAVMLPVVTQQQLTTKEMEKETEKEMEAENGEQQEMQVEKEKLDEQQAGDQREERKTTTSSPRNTANTTTTVQEFKLDKWSFALMQLGLWTGFLVLLLLCLYGGNIKLE